MLRRFAGMNGQDYATLVRSEIQQLTPREVAERLERGEAIRFVDARSTLAWNSALGQLPGAIRIPPDQVEARTRGLSCDLPVVVYCATPLQSGSAQVASRLRDLGFEEVYVLEGGYGAWRDGGYPLEPKGGMTSLHETF
jgi:rhodanese-related sulfurtransferase